MKYKLRNELLDLALEQARVDHLDLFTVLDGVIRDAAKSGRFQLRIKDLDLEQNQAVIAHYRDLGLQTTEAKHHITISWTTRGNQLALVDRLADKPDNE